ncbi:MAG: tRNA (cytidine(34)-2'-O)-methyltransferase [Desulfohalobiaceae bacterium]
MQLVLFQPQIPPNTGSIARLCAATDTPLHLIQPLGFSLDDRYLKRAGLDYWPWVRLQVWADWQEFQDSLNPGAPVILTSARAQDNLYRYAFSGQEILVLGPESQGLPEWLLQSYTRHLRVPILQENAVRSLNLANAAAVFLYEALRQTGRLSA